MTNRFRFTSPAARRAADRTAAHTNPAYRRMSTPEAMNAARRARLRSRSKAVDVLKFAGVLLVITALVALVVVGIRAHAARSNECKSHGGKVTSKTSTHTSYDNGKPHTSSDTTYYCVTPDRGIIDVWG